MKYLSMKNENEAFKIHGCDNNSEIIFGAFFNFYP